MHFERINLMITGNARSKAIDFCSVGTERSVPNAKNTPVVVCLVTDSLVVMNTVVVWCDQDIVQKTWELDVWSMAEELIKAQETICNNYFQRRKTYKHNWYEKEKEVCLLNPGESKGSTEVKFVVTMMH